MAADERLVEVSIAVRMVDTRASLRLLHGVIDLAFKTANGWTTRPTSWPAASTSLWPATLRRPPLCRPLERPVQHPARVDFIRNGETCWL